MIQKDKMTEQQKHDELCRIYISRKKLIQLLKVLDNIYCPRVSIEVADASIVLKGLDLSRIIAMRIELKGIKYLFFESGDHLLNLEIRSLDLKRYETEYKQDMLTGNIDSKSFVTVSVFKDKLEFDFSKQHQHTVQVQNDHDPISLDSLLNLSHQIELLIANLDFYYIIKEAKGNVQFLGNEGMLIISYQAREGIRQVQWRKDDLKYFHYDQNQKFRLLNDEWPVKVTYDITMLKYFLKLRNAMQTWRGSIQVGFGNGIPFHLKINNPEMEVDYFIAPKVS